MSLITNILRQSLPRFQGVLGSFTQRGIANDSTDVNFVKRYPWTRHFRVSKVRCYFPRPSERQRIVRHGWDTRMSTPGGRRVLMNRILKGRHVLSH